VQDSNGTALGGFTSKATYRRIGDSLQIRISSSVNGTVALPSGANIRLTIPSGVSIDSTKLPGTSASNSLVGQALFYGTGTGGGIVTIGAVQLAPENATTVYVSLQGDTQQLTTSRAGMNSGALLDVDFTVPVTP
jgi:hypothetical protein